MRSRAPRSTPVVPEGPGPGAYARSTDFTKKRAASRGHAAKGFGGTTGSRFGPERDEGTSPGPGEYAKTLVPPPRSRRPRSAAQRSSPGTFGASGARDEWGGGGQDGADSPGPGAYCPSPDTARQRRNSRTQQSKGFGGTTASRFGSPADKHAADAPGPGAHQRSHNPPPPRRANRSRSAASPTSRGGAGGGFGTSANRSLGREWNGGGDDTPGPGAYVSQQAASAFRKKGPVGAPGKGFGGATQARFETTAMKEREKVPGPGQYNAARSLDMMYRIPG